MKKNLRVGILASLLLAPAAVAHANDAEIITNLSQAPYNTVASVTSVESLLNLFTGVDESYSSASISVHRGYYNSLTDAEKTLLGTENMALINAKLTYLEQFEQFKVSANSLKTLIDKLTLTSKTLVVDTDTATAQHNKLIVDVSAAGATLSTVAGGTDATVAKSLLASLDYYSGTGPDDFVKGIVTNLSTLETRKGEIVLPKEFITTYIGPIEAAATDVDNLNKTSYGAAIDGARAAYDLLESSVKTIVNAQLMTSGVTAQKTLTNAETDLTKAAAVEEQIAELKTTEFETASAFKTKITAVTKAYNELSVLQKKLVDNYSELETYDSVMNVINAIDLLKVAPTKDFRDAVDAADLLYSALEGTVLKSYVTNAEKLEEMKILIAKAETVEVVIDAITPANASTQVTLARAAYKGLLSVENKYVLKEKYEVLTAWEKSATTAATVVKQINAIVVSKSDFVSKTKTAIAGYTKIGSTTTTGPTREQELVTNSARLLALQPFADIANLVSTLKVTSKTYVADLEVAKTAFEGWSTIGYAGLEQVDIDALNTLEEALSTKLTTAVNEKEIAAGLVARIDAVKNNMNLAEMAAIRAEYNAKTFSSNAKKLVTNIKVLTDLEKQYKAALNVVTLINKLDVKAKDYAKKVIAAEAAYLKISPTTLQQYVNNYAIVSTNLPAVNLMIEIDALKPTDADFRTKLNAAKERYTTIAGSTAVQDEPKNAVDLLVKNYPAKLSVLQEYLTDADAMIADITKLRGLTGQPFMDALNTATEKFKKLPATTKKLVTNANVLTDIQKDYTASLKVFNLIENLPTTIDKTCSNKVADAEKAYQKLTTVQKGYVYNYATKITPILKIADLIGRIEALKISSKTYEVEVEAIRSEYNVLSEAEKALVHNYKKLESAESNMSGADAVILLIDQAIPNAADYIAKLLAARQAFDSLSKDQQKLVLNIKDLTTRENSVKPVLTLDKEIIALDPSNAKTFISKFSAAIKAYEKLSYSERSLLTKEDQLSKVLQPLYNVINGINVIKSSSKTFVQETQAVRNAYNALTEEQKALISNYSTLLEHEMNVQGGASVDALIQALRSNSPAEYVQKVKEAREAYNALSSANKKAVTLLDTLTTEEKYIKPVETVIDAINGLSNPRNDLSKQYDKARAALEKLNAEQITFVSNYDRFTDLSQVINVYQLIAKLKPSDKYYLGNLEAAKLAYERLTVEDKQRVTNYYKLQEAETDVGEIQQVINIIASLSSNSSTYFTDIANAVAVYKKLPSASKKQVMNYSVLQEAEKNMKAAQKVMDSINELDPDLRTFESKTKATLKAYDKLTDEQKKIVSNYNLLRQYAFDLGL
ncbi:hypothetical protein [Solibacillus sp. FSL H8-0538]|uniref:hypothetical protein n=1 Tax=Solibacillus sp. FSL H8-0538 TaxID=2921400 RepID=UPI0030F85E50